MQYLWSNACSFYVCDIQGSLCCLLSGATIHIEGFAAANMFACASGWCNIYGSVKTTLGVEYCFRACKGSSSAVYPTIYWNSAKTYHACIADVACCACICCCNTTDNNTSAVLLGPPGTRDCADGTLSTVYKTSKCFFANPSTGRLVSCETRINCCFMLSKDNSCSGADSGSCRWIIGNLACTSRLLYLNGGTSGDVGVFISRCGDCTGLCYATLRNIGIEIGSGGINRGFYEYCNGSFKWLQYFGADVECHTTKNFFTTGLCSNGVCNTYYCTIPLLCSMSVACCSCLYVLLGCYTVNNVACANELDLTFDVNGTYVVNSVNLKMLLRNASISCFSPNNIEIKATNYTCNLFGVRGIGFSSSVTCFCGLMCIWALVCNESTSALSWNMGLHRNMIDACFHSSMYCTTTAPTFKCFICIAPSCNQRNFYFNNAIACLPNIQTTHYRYSNNCCTAIALGSCCSKTLVVVIGNGNSWPSDLFICTTGTCTGACSSLQIRINPSLCCERAITATFTGNCSYLVPYRISSQGNAIYIDYAACCAQTLTACIKASCVICGCATCIASYCWADLTGCSWCNSINIISSCQNAGNLVNYLASNIILANCISSTSSLKNKCDINKTNIKALDIINNTDIVSFKYKGENAQDLKHIGFIAEYTNDILSGKNKDQMRINDTIGVLLKAVKELTPWYKKLWYRIKNRRTHELK